MDHHFHFRISGSINTSEFCFFEKFTSIKSGLPVSVISIAACLPGANAYIFRIQQKNRACLDFIGCTLRCHIELHGTLQPISFLPIVVDDLFELVVGSIWLVMEKNEMLGIGL